VLTDPDAAQLLRMLFSPLSLVIDASRDAQGQPVVAAAVDVPPLSAEACLMLDGCLRTRDAELWKSLGPAWTTPRSFFTSLSSQSRSHGTRLAGGGHSY